MTVNPKVSRVAAPVAILFELIDWQYDEMMIIDFIGRHRKPINPQHVYDYFIRRRKAKYKLTTLWRAKKVLKQLAERQLIREVRPGERGNELEITMYQRFDPGEGYCFDA